MYLVFKDSNGINFADPELHDLEELLISLDNILSKILVEIKTSTNPEADRLFERGEYFMGVGFCAMQRYLIDILDCKNIEKEKALKLGPTSKEGIPIAEIINSAGNYWKHSPEWNMWVKDPDNRAQKIMGHIVSSDGAFWYPLSNLLAELCGNQKLLLHNCIPYLKEWRLSIHIELTKNKKITN